MRGRDDGVLGLWRVCGAGLAARIREKKIAGVQYRTAGDIQTGGVCVGCAGMSEGNARMVRPACWKVAPGVVWIQVHEPGQARALTRIHGGRQVACSVTGRYLRTYEFARPLRWAERWIERRMARESGPNSGFSPLAGAQTRRTDGGMSGQPMVRATQQRAKTTAFSC
jgi:hypothetical protein